MFWYHELSYVLISWTGLYFGIMNWVMFWYHELSYVLVSWTGLCFGIHIVKKLYEVIICYESCTTHIISLHFSRFSRNYPRILIITNRSGYTKVNSKDKHQIRKLEKRSKYSIRSPKSWNKILQWMMTPNILL